MTLLAFPCDRDVAYHFCQRVDTNKSLSLILKKQEPALHDLLIRKGIKKIFVLDEKYYGAITSHQTRETLEQIRKLEIEKAFFPINDFCGNVALLLSLLCPKVIAINANSLDQVEITMDTSNPNHSRFSGMTNKEPIGYYQEQTSQIERGFERSEKKDPSLSKTAALGACRIANPYDKVATASSRLNKRQDGASTIFSDRLLDSLQASITEKLKSLHHKIHELSASSCGERPTDGLIEGMPYDNEVLSRYAYGAMKTGGRVLEIGCGLGYGSYFMVSLNKEITQLVSLDYDLTNASLANSLWTDGQHSLPLSYGCAKAEHLPFEADSFDAVVCFEVIEHLFDPEGMLNEIHRVLKNKGLLIGSTPNSNLYPFRINRERKSDPVALRKEGIWPWHYQEFTEEKVSHLLMENGFSHIEYAYPTFIKGVSLAHQIPFLNFDEALDALSTLTWKVSDFGFRSTYYPLFSGYSFIFTGVKNG